MATLLAPQDSVNMAQAQWQELFMSLFSNGVLAGQLNTYTTTTTSGLGISVASGKALIQGFLARSDAAVALTAATADPSNPRIDRAVLHADLSAHTLTVQMLTGTPAPSPTPPGLTQTSTIWEISLYQVRVNAGSTTITSLTDERGYVVPNIPSGGITDAEMANQKVNRAGDTMTGQLTVQNTVAPRLVIAQPAVGAGTDDTLFQMSRSGGANVSSGAIDGAGWYVFDHINGGFVLQQGTPAGVIFTGIVKVNGGVPVVVQGAGNLATSPIQVIVVGPSSANLPAAGVKGRVAIVVPFSLP